MEKMNINFKVDMYITHLHKCLYNEYELKKCLHETDFKNYKIFKYSHPGEEGYKINLGSFGKINYAITSKEMEREFESFLKQFDNEKILVNSIEFFR